MDIYKYFASKDIADYLKSIEYELTAPEAAYVIHANQNLTLREKHEGYREVIMSYPNASMKERPWTPEIPDFSEFLKEYMAIEKRAVDEFKDADDAEYFILPVFNNRALDFEGPYSSYGKAREEALLAMEDNDLDKIRIQKREADLEPELCYNEVWLDKDGGMLSISDPTYKSDESYQEEREKEILGAFSGMWFSFPLPFKMGDIVCSVGKKDEPFVLTDLLCWDEEYLQGTPVKLSSPEVIARRNDTIDRLEKTGDNSDMSGNCFRIASEDGNTFVIHDHITPPCRDYLDIEFYRKNLTGKYQLLKPISQYLKGEIPLDRFLLEYDLAKKRCVYETGEKLHNRIFPSMY